MKPLFTVHAGEYLVGSYIEEHYPKWDVWVPSKDTGVDLLVTDTQNARAVSLQVKFSKDFTPTHRATLGRIRRSRPRPTSGFSSCPRLRTPHKLHHHPSRRVAPAFPGHTRQSRKETPFLSVGHEVGALLGITRTEQRRPRDDCL